MIYVVGLGPGNPKYILPVALEVIDACEMVIGAKRNLDAIAGHCAETMALSVGFATIEAYLKNNTERGIAVVVSGDTGFHSMLAFVKRHVDVEKIEVIPGISSLQYMYSRLKKGYEQSPWLSLHGRSADLIPYIQKRQPIGILTDKIQNNQYIAAALKEEGRTDAILYVGERLSYADERLTQMTVEEGLTFVADPLSVVVIDYE